MTKNHTEYLFTLVRIVLFLSIMSHLFSGLSLSMDDSTFLKGVNEIEVEARRGPD
jgi:hypothetical protein